MPGHNFPVNKRREEDQVVLNYFGKITQVSTYIIWSSYIDFKHLLENDFCFKIKINGTLLLLSQLPKSFGILNIAKARIHGHGWLQSFPDLGVFKICKWSLHSWGLRSHRLQWKNSIGSHLHWLVVEGVRMSKADFNHTPIPFHSQKSLKILKIQMTNWAINWAINWVINL